MKVKDIMSKEVITVRPETPVDEVAHLFVENNISGVPVVDDENNVIGIIEEEDLFLKEKGMPFSAVRLPRLFQEWVDPVKLEEIYAEAHLRKAKEIMNHDIVFVSPEEMIPRVALLMAKGDRKHVVVVHKGVLVGIVTRSDIIRYLARRARARK